jgi:hypothetical protein
MTTWTTEELKQIGAADEVQAASLRSDGSLRKPVTIWAVAVGGELYARSVNGPSAGWFRGVQVRHQGRIQSGGVERDVTFVEAGTELNEQIDAAYRIKYRRYAARIVDSIVSAQARAATIKLAPR